MNKRKFFILNLLLVLALLPWGISPVQAGPGTRAGADAAATPSGGTFYANSPAGVWFYTDANGTRDPFGLGSSNSGTPLRKFVDSLPGLGAGARPAGTALGANNLGQYIPIAVPGTFAGNPYYEIGLRDYRARMHSDLPLTTDALGTGTLLRGYYQINGTDHSSQYLGPLIIANKNIPVRVKFTNQLGKSTDPAGNKGKLFIPVDTTVMGAGPFSIDWDPLTKNPIALTNGNFTENRATLHLHGGFTPWISDGTTHQWTVPAGEVPAIYKKGASVVNVPDMPAPGDGSLTFYYPNQQSGRLMFYHDHAYGITRLNVYAGEAAGYLLVDPVEEDALAAAGVPGTIGTTPDLAHLVPLIIQDKTFIPQDVAVQDAKWTNVLYPARGVYGDLWFPHVYETNQNPNNLVDGTNSFGRWDYGPWFWPVFPVTNNTLPEPSLVPEGFMDTPVVNGTAYPYLEVQPTAYRFRILNACNDRFVNLQIYQADPNISVGTAGLTEVKMVPAVPHPPAELAAGFGSGLSLYQGGVWSGVNSLSPANMVFQAATSTLYAGFGASGLWKFDGGTWVQISTDNPLTMMVSGTSLYVGFAASGLRKWDGTTWTNLAPSAPENMVDTGTVLYVDFGVSGLWTWNGTTWTRIAPGNPGSMVYRAATSTLYVGFAGAGLWKYDGTTWTNLATATPGSIADTGTVLYVGFAGAGLYTYDGTTWTRIATGNPDNMVYQTLTSTLYADFGIAGLWTWDGATWTNIAPSNPVTMVASDSALYVNFGLGGLWKYNPTANPQWNMLSSGNANTMALVNFSGTWPATWPTDGRDGGVPDPATRGPAMIQIGTEGGILPAPAVLPNQPIGYEYFRRSITVLNVSDHDLFLGPAERADVIIDFSKFAGKTLILYNDAPAPVPAFDARNDYYTGDPDQTAGGGAPMTRAGFGPNTRTIMQFRVAAGPDSTAPADYYNPLLLTALNTALPAAYALRGELPIVPESAYNAAFGTAYTDKYASIFTGSLTTPSFDFVAGQSLTYRVVLNNTTITGPLTYFLPGAPLVPIVLGQGAQAVVPTDTKVTVAAGATAQIQPLSKAIQELFDPTYGRMNATLGVELPATSALIQTTIPLEYIDPATETLNPGETQLWKITHNGVDTHAIHFHLLNVQVINRVGWDGTIKPPNANELGWKDTVRMNPLEDIVVAMQTSAPTLPWPVPNSIRPLDVTMPLNSTGQFTNVDPATNTPIVVTNVMTDFGWEYVWHCHLLGHEENDMMRPLVFRVP
jgi:FtsP/CotA-like multicopper oxidase with cupredoxin domain